MGKNDELIQSRAQLMIAIQYEAQRFKDYYTWLEKNMPKSFFLDISRENILLIAHSLMGFHLESYYSQINLGNGAIVLCLDNPEADETVLKNFRRYGMKYYSVYVSKEPPPVHKVASRLRIVMISFTEVAETQIFPFPKEEKERVKHLIQDLNPELHDEDFWSIMDQMNTRFLTSVSQDRLVIALNLFFRAQEEDGCQFEVRYNEDWQERDVSSMEVILAWKNTSKADFLYQLAKVIRRHELVMRRVNATYINAYTDKSTLMMVIGLHGQNSQAAWDVADILDFLQELSTLKYFDHQDRIEKVFVDTGLIRGNLANFLRALVDFVHQTLVPMNRFFYSIGNIEEDLCRHPELIVRLCKAFEAKFHPDLNDIKEFQTIREQFLILVGNLDTGIEYLDERRKNVLKQGMNFIEYTLKTNFYRNNKSALCFRLDPRYLDDTPYDRKSFFPELPFSIFFMKGLHFIGFHIRFKDLARGGLRTLYPKRIEHAQVERNDVFMENYSLAFTQHKKNKDIPEGGAKGVIFLDPGDSLDIESKILEKELETYGVQETEIDQKLNEYRNQQKWSYMYHAQRAYVTSLLSLVNCEPDGTLRAKNVADYYQKPEYIYLGPDENMHSHMITWIANFSQSVNYKPGGSFISSKPGVGINHKEHGVTSLGVNTYVREVLKYLGIDPEKDTFTVKMSGGPDGDVAGNQIKNLYHYFPHTAKLIALTDASGTINDPEGLDLEQLYQLFLEEKPIKFYDPHKLSEGGFLLDMWAKRDQTAYSQQTLCYRKKAGKLIEDWLSGNEMNALFRNNVHQARTDIFIPCGGRPATLHKGNYKEFLDEKGEPTSKAIVEGANLYLTPESRSIFEDLGVIIIKDSSANKAGVIASSYEVLCGLVLSDEEMVQRHDEIVKEVLKKLEEIALKEAKLLLRTHEKTGLKLTSISEAISEKINTFMYQLLSFLEDKSMTDDISHPLTKCFLNYCLDFLKKNYQDRLLNEVPESHKKAIIACHIASRIVYNKGLDWSPSIVDILPLLLADESIC